MYDPIGIISPIQVDAKAVISNQMRIEGRLTVSELKEAERVLIEEAQRNFERDQNF